MNKLSQAAIAKRLEESEIAQKLQAMTKEPTLNTMSSYTANTTLYPDNTVSFVDKHMAYLMSHPKVDFDHYLANLRLMLKKRG